jgi:hypothetical protein
MERQDYYTYKSFTENFIIGRSLLNCPENTQLDDTHSILDFLKSINKDKDKDKDRVASLSHSYHLHQRKFDVL